LDVLEGRRVSILATAAQGDRRYDEADLRGPVAIVVGSEGAGLPAAVLERAAARLRIPLREPVESLNVGVAAALVLFEAARQRGFPGVGPGE
jgi:tRNA G18 (ribose-2'-O)-methylase SpoU